jgi:hypothetical protein
MPKWKRPSGKTIVTNDAPATVALAAKLKWELVADAKPVKKAKKAKE